MPDQKKPDPSILSARKQRAQEMVQEARKLKPHRTRIKKRLAEGRDWPLDSVTGDRADVDKDDVMAPLPDDMKVPVGNLVDDKMQFLRKEADQHRSFTGDVVPVDPGVLHRRQREHERERAQRDRVRGEVWTADMVEARLEEAYRTLFRASVGGAGPRQFGNAMPTVVREVSDLVHQAGNKSLRNAIAHRFKGTPSIEEVRRADEALGWAMSYLNTHHPDLAGFVNLGAMWRAWGAKIAHKCRDIGVHRQAFYRDRKTAVQLIVEGLIREGKAPT